ncbi:MAG: sulfite exporter TauE/SafE family protein [Patescibacteria group bacterium]
MNKILNFKISGMHCQSCKTLVEEEVKSLPGINKIEVDYASGLANLEYDDTKISLAEIFKTISKLNYQPQICETKQANTNQQTKKPSSFLLGILIPLAIGLVIGAFYLFTTFGGFQILAKLNEPNIGYGLIFMIGLLASFHCIGMCGGLVIAYSTSGLKSENQEKKLVTPHFQYNLGRLISYTVIGGVLGGIGKFFGINPVFTGIVLLIAGGLMILMGLSFVTKWQILEKIKLRTPNFIAKYLFGQKHSQKPKGPFIIGLFNGFMPCGPLQAMQLYALASGSFIKGGLSMAVYALGTIPLMFGFGIFVSKISHQFIGKIIKVSGVLVIILGIIMFNRGLTNLGSGFTPATSSGNSSTQIVNGYQEVKMDLGTFGYEPNVLYVKKGVPVRWIINVKQMSGCTSAIRLDDYNIYKQLNYGENIIEFTPDKLGELKFSCGMRMVWGKFLVQ